MFWRKQKKKVGGYLTEKGRYIMSVLSSAVGGLLGGLGSTSGSSSSWGGVNSGGTGNSAQTAMNFNREMMQAQMEYNAAEAEKARQHSALEAEKTRNWQKQQTDTAYQRAVEDLKKAGLNPILAASRGGAESGAGAMGAISSANAGLLGGMTDYNIQSSNWGTSSGYSYSNLAEGLKAIGDSVKEAFSGLSGLINVNVGGNTTTTTTGNSSGKGLTSAAKNILGAAAKTTNSITKSGGKKK